MAKHISHGADVEQLDDIAVGLRRQGDRIGDVGGQGALLLERLRALWEGPDFEKFAHQWRAAHRSLDEAEAAMRAFSRKLVQEAESQRGGSGEPALTAFERSRHRTQAPAFHLVDPLDPLPAPGRERGLALDPRRLDLDLDPGRSRAPGWLRLDERPQED